MNQGIGVYVSNVSSCVRALQVHVVKVYSTGFMRLQYYASKQMMIKKTEVAGRKEGRQREHARKAGRTKTARGVTVTI